MVIKETNKLLEMKVVDYTNKLTDTEKKLEDTLKALKKNGGVESLDASPEAMDPTVLVVNKQAVKGQSLAEHKVRMSKKFKEPKQKQQENHRQLEPEQRRSLHNWYPNRKSKGYIVVFPFFVFDFGDVAVGGD